MADTEPPPTGVVAAWAPVNEWHTCHFCGEDVCDGLDSTGERHWLSDCRPDLVEHEIGPLCTWHGLPDGNGKDCYAYSKPRYEVGKPGIVWTNEHAHFYPDGPM